MVSADPDLIGTFERLTLALAIGFLVGVERGWKQREQEEGERAAGLRTFALSGLLGGICGLVGLKFGGVAFGALALAFVGVFTAFTFREQRREDNYSATSVVAAMVVFAVSAYAQYGHLLIAAGVGVATAAILAFKSALHQWLQALRWPELRSALLILAMTFIALPILPDRALDPYGALNPRELWMLTILIAGVSFVGYVTLRAFGERAGLLLGACVGALVSSTVVTLELAGRVRAGEAKPVLGAAAAILASMVMVTRIAVLSSVFATAAFAHVWPALLAAGVAGLAVFAVLYVTSGRHELGLPYRKVENPLDLKSVLRFSLILGVLMVAARLIVHAYGARGALIFAATGGLLDADAVVLAIGGLLPQGEDPNLAAAAILLAAAVDTISKAAITTVSASRRFAGLYVAGSALMLASGAAAYFLI